MNKKKKIRHTFINIIWKLYTDEINHKLIIETRNSEKRMTHFFCYDMTSNEIVTIELDTHETWWLGIEDVYDGNIYFHYYNPVEFSNHLGIVCFNINSNKVIWEHKDLEFYKLTSDTLIAINNSKKNIKFLQLDLQNGNIIENFNFIDSQKNDFVVFTKRRNDRVFSPIIYSNLDEDFGLVSLFIQKKINVIPDHSLEYLEFANYIIISFNIFDKETYVNKLLVISLEGNVILEEVLMQAEKGIGVGTFFVCNGKLIFVKLKNELFIYDL